MKPGEKELLPWLTCLLADSGEVESTPVDEPDMSKADRSDLLRLLGYARLRTFWARQYTMHYRVKDSHADKISRQRMRRINALLRRAQRLIEQEGNYRFADIIAQNRTGRK